MEFVLLIFDTFVIRGCKNAPVSFAMLSCLATCSSNSGIVEWIFFFIVILKVA